MDESTAAELLNLARGAREQVWWTQYEDLKLDPYLGLEQVATAIASYTTYYIPALLQTEEYTRAGGPAVMAAQLDKVLEAERQAKVTIRIIPFSGGVPAVQDSNFVLLEFGEDSGLSPLVFVEGLTGNQYLERPADIARYREATEYLRDSALSAPDSVLFVSTIRKTYLSQKTSPGG